MDVIKDACAEGDYYIESEFDSTEDAKIRGRDLCIQLGKGYGYFIQAKDKYWSLYIFKQRPTPFN